MIKIQNSPPKADQPRAEKLKMKISKLQLKISAKGGSASGGKNYNKGFTLLLAVLINSILLTISMGFSIFVLRELNISSIGRESQKAVFASDSGIECALYWDLVHGGYPESAFSTSTARNISCVDFNSTVGGSSDISDFTFNLNFDNEACAQVIVDKINFYPNTRIESRGYSTCDANARYRTERAFRVSY